MGPTVVLALVGGLVILAATSVGGFCTSLKDFQVKTRGISWRDTPRGVFMKCMNSYEEVGNVVDDSQFVIRKSLLSKARSAPLVISKDCGVGTLAWGDAMRGFELEGKTRKAKAFEAIMPAYGAVSLQKTYETLRAGGIELFDTSEMYGHRSMKFKASSEYLLGKFIRESKWDQPMVATTFNPLPWANFFVGGSVRMGRDAIVSALQRSLERLDLAYIDLYQVQFPFPYVGGISALAEGMARAQGRGLCKHVGVCNMRGKQVRKFKEELDKFGVPLSTNQVEFSLADQSIGNDGTIAECKKLGVQVLAHTPLCRGLASGVYTAKNPTGGKHSVPKYKFTDELQPLTPVHNALAEVSQRVSARLAADKAIKVNKASTTQVSLNYVRSKGLIPLPGVCSELHARELAAGLTWQLNGEEKELLDDAYVQYHRSYPKLVTTRRIFDPRILRNIVYWELTPSYAES